MVSATDTQLCCKYIQPLIIPKWMGMAVFQYTFIYKSMTSPQFAEQWRIICRPNESLHGLTWNHKEHVVGVPLASTWGNSSSVPGKVTRYQTRRWWHSVWHLQLASHGTLAFPSWLLGPLLNRQAAHKWQWQLQSSLQNSSQGRRVQTSIQNDCHEVMCLLMTYLNCEEFTCSLMMHRGPHQKNHVYEVMTNYISSIYTIHEQGGMKPMA